MSKISVIIAHEYLTRVKNKWFIIGTLLAPLGLVLMFTIPILAAALAGDGQEGKVAVIDRTQRLEQAVVLSDTATFTFSKNRSEEQLKAAVEKEELQAYIIIPENVLEEGIVTMYSKGGSGIAFKSAISDKIEPLITKARLTTAGTDTAVVAIVQKGITINALKISDKGVEADSSAASAALGYGVGFVIYMLIFIYGAMVMRGVVEEKANRIVEVIISSVRPYDIMMGKVLGIGLVGLTQMVAWVALSTVVTIGLGYALAPSVDPAQMQQAMQGMQGMGQMNMPGGMQNNPTSMMVGGIALPNISLVSILLFMFYFLAGYFIYATLYAAVGSAVDQEADASQLTLPITLPVIIPMLFIGNIIAAPNGTTAVVLSLIPLFTPILMPVRIAATDVPVWQVLTSLLLCIGTFMGAIWIASRIYRIGVLSYGKKPSLKDLSKWIMMKD